MPTFIGIIGGRALMTYDAQQALEHARKAAGTWADELDLDGRSLDGAIRSSRAAYQRPPPARRAPDGMFGWIVADVGRDRSPTSFKPANAGREILRTLSVSVAFGGVAQLTGGSADAAFRAITVLAGFLLAGGSALTTRIGYSDAAVLHKAWRLAALGDGRSVALAALLDVKDEIATEYKAPKCASETEVLDAVNNLCGLKAMKEIEGRLHLQERVTFLERGRVK